MTRVVAIGEVMIELAGGADDQWHAGVAGDTLNTLWYMRAGLDPLRDSVDYVTALGTDSQSDRIIRRIREAGIGTQHIRRLEGRLPGLYMIEERDGDRAFLYWRGQSAARALASAPEALRLALRDADMVYLSGITLAILPDADLLSLINLLDAARAAGSTIAFDPNIRPALWPDPIRMRQVLTDMAARADIVLPSFDDEAAAFGDTDPAATVARYRAAGAAEVVVKDGGRAVHLSDGTTVPVNAAQVVDATGAGDSFNGSYLTARASGESMRAAAEAGNAIASQVVKARGAIIPMPHDLSWRIDAAEIGVRAAGRFVSTRLPRWLKIALPGGSGPAPVIEAVDQVGPVTTLSQCRAAFTLAHLYDATRDADLLAAALRIHHFAAASLRDADGGYRVAVAPDGTPLDAPEAQARRSYDQSFALLALAELHRVAPDVVPQGELAACWSFIETHLVDPATGALWEDDRGAGNSAMRAQNPHMHMLEALLVAFDVTGDAVWLTRAEGMVKVATTYFIDDATGSIREWVGPDLSPLPGGEGGRREPGHQFEWAWLLRRYARMSGDQKPIELARRLQSFAETHGMRRDGPMKDASYDAVDASGAVTEDTHLLWPLTEAGKLYADLAANGEDDDAAWKVHRIAGMIFGRYFAPGTAPRWVNQLDARGDVVWDVALTRLLYHVAIFLTEGSRAGFWVLDGQDGMPAVETIPAPSEFSREEIL